MDVKLRYNIMIHIRKKYILREKIADLGKSIIESI